MSRVVGLSLLAWALLAPVAARAESVAPAADAPAVAPAESSPPSAAALVNPSKPSLFRLFGIGAATTLVVTPASMALGAWVGTWSNSFVAAALSGLLIVALIPPLAVVLVEYALGNRLWGQGTFKLGWPLAAGIAIQLALVVVTALLGLPGSTIPGIAIFTAMDLVLLGGATSGVMFVTRVEPMATVAQRKDAGLGSAGDIDLPRAPAAALMTARF